MTTAFEDIEVSDWNKLRSTIQEEGFHLSQFNDEGMNLLHAACSNSNTPADIIEKEEFGGLISQLKEQYDYILLDCPPVGLVADYQSLAIYLDLTLFVVKQHYTTLKSLEKFLL